MTGPRTRCLAPTSAGGSGYARVSLGGVTKLDDRWLDGGGGDVRRRVRSRPVTGRRLRPAVTRVSHQRAPTGRRLSIAPVIVKLPAAGRIHLLAI